MKYHSAILLPFYLFVFVSQIVFSQQPNSKGHWSYENGQPISVTFDYGTNLTAPEIEQLSTLSSITAIRMGYAGIDSESVTIEGDLLPLGQLKNLEEVHLCKDGIHDEDLEWIAKLPKIHTLEFNADNGYTDAPICTDRCADYLSAATTLRVLKIHDGAFTDKFVAKITKNLPHLEELMLHSSALTDKSLYLIAEHCKKLKVLSISSDYFTTQGREQLARLKHSENVSIISPLIRKERRSHKATGVVLQ